MSEEWKIDEYGYVHGPEVFFNIKDVQSLLKNKERCIVFGFMGGRIEIEYAEADDRDSIFKMFKAAILERNKEEIKIHKEHIDYHHNYQEALLANIAEVK